MMNERGLRSKRDPWSHRSERKRGDVSVLFGLSTEPRAVQFVHNALRWAASAPLVVGLALLLTGLAAACEPRVPPPDLAEQLAAARTADDYAAVARALAAKADEYAAVAGEHRRLAAAYAASASFLWYRHHDRSELRFADHCNRAAEDLEGAAAALRELAREQEEIAQILREEQEAR